MPKCRRAAAQKEGRKRTLRTIALSLLLMTSVDVVHAEDAEHAILSANEAFEKAWSTRDITAIEKLWLHEPYVFVVHPSSKVPEIGWENVRSSFGAQMSHYSEFAVSMTGTRSTSTATPPLWSGLSHLRENGSTETPWRERPSARAASRGEAVNGWWCFIRRRRYDRLEPTSSRLGQLGMKRIIH